MDEPLSKSQQRLRGRKLVEMTDDELLEWIDACEKMERGVSAAKARRSWKQSGQNAHEELKRRRMNETEWLACCDPGPMLEFLGDKVSDRKRRLFACACCRRIQHFFSDERSLKAVEVAELYADGLKDRVHLIGARDEARDVKRQFRANYAERQFLEPADAVVLRAAGAAQDVTRDTGMSAAINCYCETSRAMNMEDTNDCNPAELRQQALLVQCIFGNPFKPAFLDPSWLRCNDDTVVKLARGIYDEQAFDRLHILANALEATGCSDTEILDHCRIPGPHFRGCWVIDLLLGKN